MRAKGLNPSNPRRARVRGFALRIGQRATLVPAADDHVYGMVMDLSHDEIDRLYAEPTVAIYRAEAVIADLDDGSREAALCFNLVQPPSPDERNADYAYRLRELAHRLNLPGHDVEGIT